MTEKIDYRAMDDHDLLVMSVMQGNDTVKQQEKIIGHLQLLNDSISKHEKRLTILETITTRPVNLSKKQAISIGGSIFILGYFLTGIVSAIGTGMGLW